MTASAASPVATTGGEPVRGLIVTALADSRRCMSTSDLRRHLDQNFNVLVMNETLYRSLAILERRGEVVKLDSRGRNAVWRLSENVQTGHCVSTPRVAARSRGWEPGTDAIMIVRTDGILLHTNRTGAVALGLPFDDNEFGTPWLELLPEDVRGQGLRALDAAVGGVRSSFIGMTDRPTRRYWEHLLSPIVDADGQIRQVLCIARDITSDLSRRTDGMERPKRRRAPRNAPVAGIGGTFTDRLNRLFAAVRAPGHGAYTNSEVIRALAEKGVHVSAPYMSQLRSGTRKRPSEHTVDALAEFFGVRPVYFADTYEREDLQYLVRLDADLRWLQLAHDPEVRRIVMLILELPERAQQEIREFLATAT